MTDSSNVLFKMKIDETDASSSAMLDDFPDQPVLMYDLFA